MWVIHMQGRLASGNHQAPTSTYVGDAAGDAIGSVGGSWRKESGEESLRRYTNYVTH